MGSVKISENGLRILNDRDLSYSIANAIIRGKTNFERGKLVKVTNRENVEIGTVELVTGSKKKDKNPVNQ